MSFELILPFFPEELRTLLLDPTISDLMINGTTGVFADRGGVVEHITLSTPYSNDRLQAAIERVARLLGQDLTSQNPILNTRLETSILLATSRGNATTVLRDAATAYKVDTAAIASKVKQEFAAKEKAKKAQQAAAKSATKAA